MKAGRITAKLRDAVPVCFMVDGKEMARYKNIELPDAHKELEIMDFRFNVPMDGKITFELIFDKGVLPDVFPPARTKVTRAEKAAAKAATMAAAVPVKEATYAAAEVKPKAVQPASAEAIPAKDTKPAAKGTPKQPAKTSKATAPTTKK